VTYSNNFSCNVSLLTCCIDCNGKAVVESADDDDDDDDVWCGLLYVVA